MAHLLPTCPIVFRIASSAAAAVIVVVAIMFNAPSTSNNGFCWLTNSLTSIVTHLFSMSCVEKIYSLAPNEVVVSYIVQSI